MDLLRWGCFHESPQKCHKRTRSYGRVTLEACLMGYTTEGA